MSLIVKHDEKITVGKTPGLVAGSTSFTFDGTNGTEDWRGFEISISKLPSLANLVSGVDYSWVPATGVFQLLVSGVSFVTDSQYNVYFQDLSTPAAYTLTSNHFFVREIQLPNLNFEPVLERLTSFILRYEPECLRLVLGHDLYSAMLIEDSARMVDLKYGTEYLYNGGTFYWPGLVHGDESMMAYYIYYKYMVAQSTQLTGTGVKVPDQEGGFAAAPAYKMVDSWNFFSEEASKCLSYLWHSVDSNTNVRMFPEVKGPFIRNVSDLTRPISLLF